MTTFTPEEYKAFEVGTCLQADRTEALERYNEANGTKYAYYFEYVHKRYAENIPCRVIGEPFGLSKDCILQHLRKMGIPRRPRGGPNNVKLTPEQVVDVILAEGTHPEIAKRLSIPKGSIHMIKARRIWADNEDVKRLLKERASR